MALIKYPHKDPIGSYVYIFFIDEIPSYVGKGIGRRYKAHVRESKSCATPWHRALTEAIGSNKKIHVEIYLENLSSDEANKNEVELINKYGRKNTAIGTLYNLSGGGEGLDSYAAKEISSRENVKKCRSDNMSKLNISQWGNEKTKCNIESWKNVETRAKRSNGIKEALRIKKLAAEHFNVSYHAVNKELRNKYINEAFNG